ncbi:MAG: metalloprotease [Anaerolineales bacterium]|jgi:Zn-dependent protease
MMTSMESKHSIAAHKTGLNHVGKVFDTPLAVKGNTWLPLTQILLWGIMTWFAGKKRPSRSWGERIGVGGMTTCVILGSEWCHNLAHAAAAKLVGGPVDAIRITWGMPILIYFDVQDTSVSPRQHVTRALGGPLFNLAILPVALLARHFTGKDSPARDVAEAAVGMNTFLATVSLLPIPGIDGGPILKWSLVERGSTPAQADDVVRKVNLATSVGLGVLSAAAFKKRKYLIGGFSALLGCVALAVGAGWLKEQ